MQCMQVSYATEFYTIIGPDGRPMIVSQKSNNQSKPAAVRVAPVKSVQQTQVPSTVSVAQPLTSQTVTPVITPKPQPSQVQEHTQPVHVQMEDVHLNPSVELSVPIAPINTSQISTHSALNAEEYINNEYLEEREFNLEGKKRFYAMPEGVIDGKTGATRMQMVEREKGITQSVLQSFKPDVEQQDTPLVLSNYYHRVPQSAAVEGLGQACFTGKKIKKAKVLETKESVSLWPRASLKGEFDFEVVKLKQPIQNIQVRSYASSHTKPSFYWPFAVFLDEKACVIEGAGGFKNQDYQANKLQHETVEGIIQVPSTAHYLLLTPLASAIDLDNRLLSNQGQLKLNVIR